MYYIAEGKYGALGSTVSEDPFCMYRNVRKGPAGNCVIWGPTCDGLDKVWEGEFETDLVPGEDWVAFRGVGGTKGMGGTGFNGFQEAGFKVAVRGWGGEAEQGVSSDDLKTKCLGTKITHSRTYVQDRAHPYFRTRRACILCNHLNYSHSSTRPLSPSYRFAHRTGTGGDVMRRS